MPASDLHAKPGHLIRRCQQIAVALFMDETWRFGVTPVQYAALVAVRANPGIDQVGLGGAIALDRSSAAAVVARLERKRWLRRQQGRADRRTKRLYVTPAGSALLRRIEPAVVHAQARILAPLPRKDWARFMAQLERIVTVNNEWSRVPQRAHATPQKAGGTIGRRRAGAHASR
jgi:MarR family transcriptional regulator, lower aerobic nicotinate degradation pathway regulator